MPDRPVWYFDLISPFVFLQLEQRGELFVRLQPVCRPVLFGALLKEHGSLGPVEIPIGMVRIVQVKPKTSTAIPIGELMIPPKSGDIVRH